MKSMSQWSNVVNVDNLLLCAVLWFISVSICGSYINLTWFDVLDHNAVIKYVDKDASQDIYKYIEDLTLSEEITQNVKYLIYNTGGIQTHFFRPEQTQKSFDKLNEACSIRGNKINEKKSQWLSVPNNTFKTKAWLKLRDVSVMYSVEFFQNLEFYLLF